MLLSAPVVIFPRSLRRADINPVCCAGDLVKELDFSLTKNGWLGRARLICCRTTVARDLPGVKTAAVGNNVPYGNFNQFALDDVGARSVANRSESA